MAHQGQDAQLRQRLERMTQTILAYQRITGIMDPHEHLAREQSWVSRGPKGKQASPRQNTERNAA